jgi:hypothetical protein
MNRVAVWGLKNTRHSHRFIHKGFYENFIKLGFDTVWCDDGIKYQNIDSDIFFVSGVAAKNLKLQKKSNYIFHNINLTKSDVEFLDKYKVNYLNLQVFTHDSYGEKLGSPNIVYDSNSNTLYQPWGTPQTFSEWQNYSPLNSSRFEWWVGAVWNNELNQGNMETINEYRQLLRKYGVLFVKRGGSKFSLDGISDSKNSRLIRKSRFGATIVGSWQKYSGYIPCRLFKNITFGIPPLSNMSAPLLLSDKSGFLEDIDELLNFAMNEGDKNRMARLDSARNDIRFFTYEESIKRILRIIENK